MCEYLGDILVDQQNLILVHSKGAAVAFIL